MARSPLLVLAALGVMLAPAASDAGDLFTGFQIDDKSQYFGYLGVRAPLLLTSGGPDLFVQAMTAGLGYSFTSNGRLLDANVQFVVPSLGITQTVGRWTCAALAGPQLRRIEEERLNGPASIDHQIGVYGQVEAFYWHENGSLHAIGSYADLDHFFWSRLRGKLLAYRSPNRCCRSMSAWATPSSARCKRDRWWRCRSGRSSYFSEAGTKTARRSTAEDMEAWNCMFLFDFSQANLVHCENVAAWPTRRPCSSTTFHTVAASTRNRSPVADIRTPR